MRNTATSLDANTAELLAASLREVCTTHRDGHGLATALDELGWAEVVQQDPATATTLLFAEHGRALASSRVLDDVVLRELAVSLPEPAGPRAVLYSHSQHDVLLGPLAGIVEVVAITADGDVRLLPAERISVTAIAGFDPESGWLLAENVPQGEPVAAHDGGKRAVAAAWRALAAELVGICEAALALAVAHTSSRIQYGRPIATFQAVRHRLAESHVAIEATRSNLAAAWTEQDGWSARLAKLRAGSAQAEVMRNSLQVFGAMGLSREGELHGYVTRAAALDTLLGGHRTLAEDLGTELLTCAELRPVVDI